MTTDQIKPALTAEKWAEARYHAQAWGKQPNAFWHFDDAVGEIPDAQFYLVALNNAALPDDDPRKITRADVDECLSVAREWEARADESLEWSHRETQYEWERRAAKLAALLPPE